METIQLNPILLPPIEVDQGYRPKKKTIHVDPRVVVKKQGSGKFNWGSIRDAIEEGIEFERISRNIVTYEDDETDEPLISLIARIIGTDEELAFYLSQFL